MPSERPCWRLDRLLWEDLEEEGLGSVDSTEVWRMWSAFLARDLRELRIPEWALSRSDEEDEKRLTSVPGWSEPLVLNGDGQSEVSITSVILAVIAEGEDLA